MRINKFVAQATGLSRRAADRTISEGRVDINQRPAALGDSVTDSDKVSLDGRTITPAVKSLTIMLNKPPGYVCSRQGQGSRTIYDLLPVEYHQLKTVGRLDKDSSGLLLLTSDGDLANRLTHPSYAKTKVYEIKLDKPLAPAHQKLASGEGVRLDDGPSRLGLRELNQAGTGWEITMAEGRNRQIRRTFETLGYTVKNLRRVKFGTYSLDDLALGQYDTLS